MGREKATLEVVKATHTKHYTEAELKARQQSTVKPPPEAPTAFQAPKWMPEAFRKDFAALRGKLVARGLIEEIDKDTLAHYFVAHHGWQEAERRSIRAVEHNDSEGAKEWRGIASSYFKECRSLAADLGMTISSRAKLVLPAGTEKPTESPLEKMLREKQERQRRA